MKVSFVNAQPQWTEKKLPLASTSEPLSCICGACGMPIAVSRVRLVPCCHVVCSGCAGDSCGVCGQPAKGSALSDRQQTWTCQLITNNRPCCFTCLSEEVLRQHQAKAPHGFDTKGVTSPLMAANHEEERWQEPVLEAFSEDEDEDDDLPELTM
ncbi:MAG: uncharacterized protein KVP18_002854 [Porospora cf. gigantea A]|uniref:uncharacterized protein n=1 Tax=Porospora cf. gigantea A TaxID=2853593 RepID=UPI00355A36E5|nr:MAG: hypothetical protein KVP18_002854 [Porospora cf. gigantea A]